MAKYSNRKYDPAYEKAMARNPSAQRRRKQFPFWIIPVILVIALTVFGAVMLFRHGIHLPGRTKQYDATHQEITEESIIQEPGCVYVDSQLLLTASEDASYKEIKKLVEAEGGEIVGYLEISGDYQIEFPDGKTRAELESLIDRWSSDPLVELISLHELLPADTNDWNAPNDPWNDTSSDANEIPTDSDWSASRPDGNNWWLEAINYLPAMEVGLKLKPVNVGIIDSMFDDEHSDLDFERVHDNPNKVASLYQAHTDDSSYSHGTHVAGIIAAGTDNKTGITGVSPNARLYGCASYSSVGTYLSLYDTKYRIATLLNDGVKIISMSMGSSPAFSASCWYDANVLHQTAATSKALADRDTAVTSLSSFMRRALQRNDFLFINSAGNDRGYLYSLNGQGSEASKTHDYTLYADPVSGTSYDEIDLSGNVFANITDPNVRNHILIVGSQDLEYTITMDRGETRYSWDGNRTYSESSFSNHGADIYAPGGTLTVKAVSNTFGFSINGSRTYDILSTVPGNGTDMMVGTSMATPVVSGVAAVVWGWAPDLTAEQVRTCLLERNYNSNAWYLPAGMTMVDLPAALSCASEIAITEGYTKHHSELEGTGFFMGYPYSSESDETPNGYGDEDISLIPDTKIHIFDEEWEEVDTLDLYDDSTFSTLLQPGIYYYRATSEETELAGIGRIEVTAFNVTYEPIRMVNRALAEYQFAVLQTISKGSWNEHMDLTIDLGLNAMSTAYHSGYDLAVSHYDPDESDNTVATGSGTVDLFGLTETDYSLDYRNGVTTYNVSVFGSEQSFEVPMDPGLFNFNILTSYMLEDVSQPDKYTLDFSLNPNSLNPSSFSAVENVQELSDIVYNKATLSVKMNKDMSLAKITINLEGSMSYSGVTGSADITLIYDFTY